MNTPDPQHTIELLRPLAGSLAFHFRDHCLAHSVDCGAFYNVDNRPAVGVWSGERRVTFRWPSHAEVSFSNIGIAAPAPGDIEVTLEKEGDGKVVDALVRATENDSPVDINRSLKWTDAESQSESSSDAGEQEVTAGLELGMRALVGVEAGGELYGGGIKAETELTSKLTAGYRQAWQRATEASKSSESTTESEWSYTILAHHHSKFIQMVEETPMRQTTRATGRLTFGIEIHSPAKFMYVWPNRRALLANLQGVPVNDVGWHVKDEIAKPHRELYSSNPFIGAPSLTVFEEVSATVEHSRLITDSRHYDTKFEMHPIK